jgi:uncharacterized membrane protein YphA (DoxX/SURF4 family)
MPPAASPITASSRSPRGWLELALARLAPAVVFVGFGVAKFTSHASETASFDKYGLPHPGAFAYVIGVVEIVGGLMLLYRRTVPLAALVLTADMVGAIAVSGIGRGEMVSYTLAPALLIAMLWLLAAGWRTRSHDRSD